MTITIVKMLRAIPQKSAQSKVVNPLKMLHWSFFGWISGNSLFSVLLWYSFRFLNKEWNFSFYEVWLRRKLNCITTIYNQQRLWASSHFVFIKHISFEGRCTSCAILTLCIKYRFSDLGSYLILNNACRFASFVNWACTSIWYIRICSFYS